MATIQKMQAGGVAKQTNPKAPAKKGAFIAVQKKTLKKGKTAAKCCGGGKIKKKGK